MFQAITPTSIRTRIDVILKDPETNVPITDFSMACNFFLPLTGLLGFLLFKYVFLGEFESSV